MSDAYLFGCLFAWYPIFSAIMHDWIKAHPDKAMPTGQQLALVIPCVVGAALWPVLLILWISTVNRNSHD